MRILGTATFVKTYKKDYWSLQMLHYQMLMTVLSVLDKHAPKKWNIYVQTIAILSLKNWEKQFWIEPN